MYIQIKPTYADVYKYVVIKYTNDHRVILKKYFKTKSSAEKYSWKQIMRKSHKI